MSLLNRLKEYEYQKLSEENLALRASLRELLSDVCLEKDWSSRPAVVKAMALLKDRVDKANSGSLT